MMKKQQKGFTLIELMIVVAIIGILASVAIPMYGDYVTRTRLSTAFSSVSNIKTAIALARQEGRAIPANLRRTTSSPTAAQTTAWRTLGMGVPQLPKGITQIDVTAGTNGANTGSITLKLDDTISGEGNANRSIVLTPSFGASASWTVTYSNTSGTGGNAVLIREYLSNVSN